VLVEGPAPEVMHAEAEHDHLERISLLSAGLTPGVENVATTVEVTHVGLGGAHRPARGWKGQNISNNEYSVLCRPRLQQRVRPRHVCAGRLTNHVLLLDDSILHAWHYY
jgi:hypothetical protein